MKVETKRINLFGEKVEAILQEFKKIDAVRLKEIWDLWYELSKKLKEYSGGEARRTNLPELISEGCWCVLTGSVRVIKPSSADTYNLETGRAEQIKASIINNDLTSFGPKSKWDDLYFLDFSRLDGSFDVYKIPTNSLKSTIVNNKKNETFENQQKQGRRPRLSLKKLIQSLKILPLYKKEKIW
ncbi:MAG: Bsp6I family restriction endonuclease [Nitrospiraceae bacterium]|nr:Bsp6I family restriction endonuclease [Nitrospiraceae bacterium]